MMYGMPFPGDYLVAPDHTVRDKLFLPSYEHRPSASQVVLKHFSGETGANSIDITTGALTATVSLSTDRCFPGQELAIVAAHPPETRLAYLRRATNWQLPTD